MNKQIELTSERAISPEQTYLPLEAHRHLSQATGYAIRRGLIAAAV